MYDLWLQPVIQDLLQKSESDYHVLPYVAKWRNTLDNAAEARIILFIKSQICKKKVKGDVHVHPYVAKWTLHWQDRWQIEYHEIRGKKG